jgi:UDPglucose 6-dehydrogenase
MTINIIGFGYVGGAIGYLCDKNGIDYNVCDPIVKKTNGYFTTDVKALVRHAERLSKTNFYFVCVPTPSSVGGECDISIVQNVIDIINRYCTTDSHIIIKSTLVPGTVRKLDNSYKNVSITISPEFLRESSYTDDIYYAPFVLIGLSDCEIHAEVITGIFKELYVHNSNVEFHIKTYEECELFKYSLNVYLAMRVWYFNKIYEIAEKMGIDYQAFKPLLRLDSRIGLYGTMVPGPDGKFGFGLGCLPKECRGMVKLLENLELDNSVLKQVLEENNEFRKKKT